MTDTPTPSPEALEVARARLSHLGFQYEDRGLTAGQYLDLLSTVALAIDEAVRREKKACALAVQNHGLLMTANPNSMRRHMDELAAAIRGREQG